MLSAISFSSFSTTRLSPRILNKALRASSVRSFPKSQDGDSGQRKRSMKLTKGHSDKIADIVLQCKNAPNMYIIAYPDVYDVTNKVPVNLRSLGWHISLVYGRIEGLLDPFA